MPMSSTTPASLPLHWTLVLVDVLGEAFRWTRSAMQGPSGGCPAFSQAHRAQRWVCKPPLGKSAISKTPSSFNCALLLGARNKRGAVVSNTTPRKTPNQLSPVGIHHEQ